MAAGRLRRTFFWLLVAGAVLLGAASLALMGRHAPELAEFGRRHVAILGINAAVAAFLLVVIAAQCLRLVREYRRRAPGARLRVRLVTIFATLSLVPLLVVYFFAVQFLNGGIDTWLDAGLEREIATSLRLSRASLDGQTTSRLLQTSGLAAALSQLEGPALSRAVSFLRSDTGADELTVFGASRRIIATSSGGERLPPQLGDDARDELRKVGQFVALEPAAGARYQIRAAVGIPGELENLGPRYLQAIFPVGVQQGRLADSVQDVYSRYREARYLREPLKYSLTATLSLVLLMSLLAAAGGALFFARRLVAPLERLVAGTEAVAKGELDLRLPAGADDEVGFLIQSFNGMVERLARAREESHESQQQLERERANLAAILGRLSTGVLAIGGDGRIRIANDAAGEILDVDLTGSAGRRASAVAARSPLLGQFLDAWAPHLRPGESDWRDQVTIRTGTTRRILNCASSALPGDSDGPSGAIVVFDDVTDLLLAQREAAWGEVARRLAHEIKNPLTPIRLAAERLRRRYLVALSPEEAQVLDRSTHTIVQQVEAMRDMVNAFSEYARAPQMSIARFDLNQLIREVAWLYRSQEGQPQVRLLLDPGVGEIEADAVRVRQLLHNLLRNAQEALEGRADGTIDVVTRLATRATAQGQRTLAEVQITDNGPGFRTASLPRLFEPYVTTKQKGTGLGLAIVKKLVEEHGGTVSAENLPERGARITVRLPSRAVMRDTAEPGGAQPEQRRERA